jgi:uncharacterized membrane protein YhaH (DUF805 family)
MLHWYVEALKNGLNFSGRARRMEYWFFQLTIFIVSLSLMILEFAMGWSSPGSQGILSGLFALAMVIPNIAVTVRRLHDIDRSAWALLFGLIPLVGGIILLVMLFKEGSQGDNLYGADPKLGQM